VTRDEYTAELKAVHRDRPDVRVIAFDHSFTADRAWFRLSFVDR
jgi:hypothetical protein